MNVQARRNRARLLLVIGAVAIAAGVWGWNSLRDAWRGRAEAEFQARCVEAAEAEDWGLLTEVASDWIDADAESITARRFLAQGLLASGDARGALEALDQLPRDDPRSVPGLLEKARLEFDHLAAPLAGIATSEEVLALEPRDVEARNRIVFFTAITLQRVELIRNIREAIRLGSESPDAYVYLMLCDHLYLTNGHQVNSQWLRSAPNSELFQVAAAVQLDEILQRLENQTPETADRRQAHRDKLDQLLEQYPENTALLRSFLHRYAEESNVDGVARILEMVPADAGEDSIFWRFRGWYDAATGDDAAAEGAFRKSLELFPTDWRTWQGLADVMRAQGNLEESARCQQLALTGKDLRRDIMQLPTAGDISDPLLKRLSEFAAACGDSELAESLQKRLWQRGYRD